MTQAMSFWSLLLPPKGKPVKQEVESTMRVLSSVHVTGLALGVAPKQGTHVITLECNGTNTVLATLEAPHTRQTRLDIALDQTISMRNLGDSEVHVYGYQVSTTVHVDESDEDSDGEEDEVDEYEDDDEDEEDDDAQKTPMAVPLSKALSKAASSPDSDAMDTDEAADEDEEEDEEEEDEEEEDEEEEGEEDGIPDFETLGRGDLIGEADDEADEEEEDEEEEEEEEEQPSPKVGGKRGSQSTKPEKPSKVAKKEQEPEAKLSKQKKQKADGKQIPVKADGKAQEVKVEKDAKPGKKDKKDKAADKGKPQAATPKGVQVPGNEGEYRSALVDFIRGREGPVLLSQLGSAIKKPAGVAKLKTFLQTNTDTFEMEGDIVTIAKKKK